MVTLSDSIAHALDSSRKLRFAEVQSRIGCQNMPPPTQGMPIVSWYVLLGVLASESGVIDISMQAH